MSRTLTSFFLVAFLAASHVQAGSDVGAVAPPAAEASGPTPAAAQTFTRQNPAGQAAKASITDGGGGANGGPGINPALRELHEVGYTTSDTARENTKNAITSGLEKYEDGKAVIRAKGGSAAGEFFFGMEMAKQLEQDFKPRATAPPENQPANKIGSERAPASNANPSLNNLKGERRIFEKLGNDPTNGEQFGKQDGNQATITANPQTAVPMPDLSRTDDSSQTRSISSARTESSPEKEFAKGHPESKEGAIELSDEDVSRMLRNAAKGIVGKYGSKKAKQLVDKAFEQAKNPRELIEILCGYGDVPPDFSANDHVSFKGQKNFISADAFFKELLETEKRGVYLRIRESERKEAEEEFLKKRISFGVSWLVLFICTGLLLYVIHRLLAPLQRDDEEKHRNAGVFYYLTMILVLAAVIIGGSKKIEVPRRSAFVSIVDIAELGAPKRSLASAGILQQVDQREENPERYLDAFESARREVTQLVAIGDYQGRFSRVSARSVEVRFGNPKELSLKRERQYANNQLAFAYCDLTPQGKRVVIINKDLWDKSTPEKRELVMMHELGHCVLNREHVDRSIEDINGRRPASIMHSDSTSLNENTYVTFKKEYLRELFLGAHLKE